MKKANWKPGSTSFAAIHRRAVPVSRMRVSQGSEVRESESDPFTNPWCSDAVGMFTR